MIAFESQVVIGGKQNQGKKIPGTHDQEEQAGYPFV